MFFCKSDRDDDTYRPRQSEFGVVRASGIDIAGAASHVIDTKSLSGFSPLLTALPQQQQSQQPRYVRLALKR